MKQRFSIVLMILAILLFASQALAKSGTLTWNPNSESGLAGYKVYYKVIGGGHPYNGTGLEEGDSPIDVGNVTTFTLSSLSSQVYYFVVTAYDTSNRESGYSNEVNTQGPAPPGGLRIQINVTVNIN